MKLSTENMPVVLTREADNKHHIYLYPRCNGKAWVAYEQSAHNLHLLMPHINLLHRKVESVPKPLFTLIVPQLSLDVLIEKGVNMRDCDGGRNLKLTLPREMQQKE